MKQPWRIGWPAALEFGVITNFIAASATLEKLAEHAPNRFAQLKSAVQGELAEVCGGSYLEREDPLLPIDSQLWNLRHGLDRAKELLGADIRVFARKRFGYHPHMPLFLNSNGLTKALFLVFDESSGLPSYANIVVSWPSPGGKQVDAFVRPPNYADSVETFFNLGHYWFKTTREDHAATIFLLHRDKPTAVWYRDVMELARLAPVIGKWTTFSKFMSEVTAGEYPSLMTADDFHFDFLSERIAEQSAEPVSMFPRHLRTRRRIDACWTYAALHRALSGVRDTLDVESELTAIEMQAESTMAIPARARRSGKAASPSPWRSDCNRVRSQQAGLHDPQPVRLRPAGGPGSRRGQASVAHRRRRQGVPARRGQMRAVIEVPALGFAWLPREGPPGTPADDHQGSLGDPQAHTIRNDSFRGRGRSGQRRPQGGARSQDPASIAWAKCSSSTPAAAWSPRKSRSPRAARPSREIISARRPYRRAGPGSRRASASGCGSGWAGRFWRCASRLTPQQPPAGYGWHAYFGARFAWRDERCMLVRGFNGMGYISNHPRPQTPDYLDIRSAMPKTMLSAVMPPADHGDSSPAGCRSIKSKAGRMVDVILVPEGEKTTVFELGIALDREVPMQTAWGYASPLAIVPTTKGPPHIGASGWLFHIDASNLLLTAHDPGLGEPRSAGAGLVEDAITARFLECANYSGLAEFRCVRDPVRAVVLDARGQFLLEANRSGDIVHLEVTPNDLAHVQVEFSVPAENSDPASRAP